MTRKELLLGLGGVIVLGLFLFLGGQMTSQVPNDTDGGEHFDSIVITNAGDSRLEGHTPTTFAGQGTGLFIGDNLNPNFPNDAGVQTYVSFDLREVTHVGDIEAAILSASSTRVAGTPFNTLGQMMIERVEYETFSAKLWDTSTVKRSACRFLEYGPEGAFVCDITETLKEARAQDADLLQLRLRFEHDSDNDEEQDMLFFTRGDANKNEAGFFNLEVFF